MAIPPAPWAKAPPLRRQATHAPPTEGMSTRNDRTPRRPRDHDHDTAPCVSRNVVRPRTHYGHHVFGLRPGAPAPHALGDGTKHNPGSPRSLWGPFRDPVKPLCSSGHRDASGTRCPRQPRDAHGRTYDPGRAVLQPPRQFRGRACRAATVLRVPPLRLPFPAQTRVQKRHRPACVARPLDHPPA